MKPAEDLDPRARHAGPSEDASPRRPLAILHLIDSGGVYGAEQVLLMLARLHCARGHRVIVGTIVAPQDRGDPLRDESERHGLATRQFMMTDGVNIAGLRAILEYARGEGVDVVHTHGYKANILLGLAPRRARPPAVATLHGWTSAGRSWSRMRLYEAAEKLLLARFDAVVAVSDTMGRDARLARLGGRLHVIPNGLEVDRVPHPVPADDVAAFIEGHPSIVCVGRLSPEKGVDVLLEALPRVLEAIPGLRLVILGGGDDGALRERARAAGVEKSILFAGYRATAKHYLPLFDVLVIPSRTEGLPLVLLEAMAAGTAVVATPVGSIPWVLADGACGALVARPGDASALASALIETMSDPDRRARLRAAAKRRVEQDFDSSRCADAYERIYQSLARSS